MQQKKFHQKNSPKTFQISSNDCNDSGKNIWMSLLRFYVITWNQMIWDDSKCHSMTQNVKNYIYIFAFIRVWLWHWKRFLAQSILAEIQLTGIEPPTILIVPCNSTTETRLSEYFKLDQGFPLTSFNYMYLCCTCIKQYDDKIAQLAVHTPGSCI